jgi:uracil-DNA glycosylase family 4
MLKNLLPSSNGGKRLSIAERAESFMAGQARGAVLATEEEWRSFLLRAAGEKWASCQRCPLAEGRTRPVYGEGDPSAELLIVGDAPAEQEDVSGRPFVGPAGSILRRAIASQKVGLSAFPHYIANVVGCRPPKNRKPEKTEREACEPRLLELLAILRPRVLLLLGASAAHWFGIREIGANRGIVKREHWPMLGEGGRRLRGVILTWHPSYVLRCPTRTKKATAFAQLVADLVLARRALERIRERNP